VEIAVDLGRHQDPSGTPPNSRRTVPIKRSLEPSAPWSLDVSTNVIGPGHPAHGVQRLVLAAALTIP
jgi:hypothetical protein